MHDMAYSADQVLHVLPKRLPNGVDAHVLFEFQVELEDEVLLLGEDLFQFRTPLLMSHFPHLNLTKFQIIWLLDSLSI